MDKVFYTDYNLVNSTEDTLAVDMELLDEDEAASAFVIVNGEEHKLSIIPPADRAEIIKNLSTPEARAAGFRVTEQEIMSQYLRVNPRSVPKTGKINRGGEK